MTIQSPAFNLIKTEYKYSFFSTYFNGYSNTFSNTF